MVNHPKMEGSPRSILPKASLRSVNRVEIFFLCSDESEPATFFVPFICLDYSKQTEEEIHGERIYFSQTRRKFSTFLMSSQRFLFPCSITEAIDMSNDFVCF